MNRTSFASVVPALDADRRSNPAFDAAVPSDAGVVVFIGAGAVALRALRERAPNAFALVLEPDAAAADELVTRLDAVEWLAHGRLAVSRGPDYRGARAARALPDLRSAPVIVDRQLAARAPETVARIREALQRIAFEASANAGARRASAGRYLLHTLANVPAIARESDVAALAGLAMGRPAIVAAAGPSLDDNLHDVAPFRDRAILISCDTAARPLALTGIDPDFIVAADPSPANAAHAAGLPATRAWLVGEGSLHPTAFAHFRGRAFVFRISNHEPWPWLASCGLDRGTLETWGSVATSAFSLALHLGCDPIVFVGADFAFSGGRPYCSGTSFEPQWAAWRAGGTSAERIRELLIDRWPAATQDDLRGVPARTAPHLIAFRDWIVERAARHSGLVVNATGAGLLHGGRIELESVAATLRRTPSIDADAFRAAVKKAHRAGRGDLGRMLCGVHELLTSSNPGVREAWKSFAAGAATDAAIDTVLQSSEYTAWQLGRASVALEANA